MLWYLCGIRFWFSASEGLSTRQCTGAHQTSLPLAERGMRLRLLQSLTFTFFYHLSRQRLLYKIGIALQIPLSVMGLKRFYQSHAQTEGSLVASECVWTFSHSIDQTSILRPKGRLDRLVNED